MTYTVQIFEPPAGEPLPTDHESVEDMVVRVLARGGGNPRFDVLVAELTRRFPDITSPEAEELPEWQLAWSDGPLRGNTGEPVLVLGMARGMLGETSSFVVETATRLGLAVYDDQTGEAWFLGGYTLGVEQGAQRPPDPNKLPPMREVAETIMEGLAPAFAAHGFKPLKGRKFFKRKLEGGWQEAILMMEDFGTSYRFWFLCYLRFEAIEAMREPFFVPGQTWSPKYPSIILRQNRWMKAREPFILGGSDLGEYSVASRADLHIALPHLRAQCEAALLPILDECRTIEGLHRRLNTEPPTDSVFYFDTEEVAVPLIVAHLAGDPRMAAIGEARVPKILEKRQREAVQRGFAWLLDKR